MSQVIFLFSFRHSETSENLSKAMRKEGLPHRHIVHIESHIENFITPLTIHDSRLTIGDYSCLNTTL